MTPPVLVADFDFTRRYVIAHVLRAAGHEVIESGDAADAERLLRERRCRLVFLAARLSGGDGFDLCRQWTAEGLRVVLVASDFRVSEAWRERAREVGAVALLSSTTDRDQIKVLVRRLFSSTSATG
jgi:DNA-binding response OmpR family regulator